MGRKLSQKSKINSQDKLELSGITVGRAWGRNPTTIRVLVGFHLVLQGPTLVKSQKSKVRRMFG